MNDLSQFNTLDKKLLACPYDFYKVLRETAPVYQDENTGIYYITLHDDVKAAEKDWETFSSVIDPEFFTILMPTNPKINALYEEAGIALGPGLISRDPPDHTFVRAFVASVFKPSRVKAWVPEMRELANELIDEFIERGECNFLSEYAEPFPMILILQRLGVPIEDIDDMKKWSDSRILSFGGLIDEQTQIRYHRDVIKQLQYFTKMIERARASEPADNIVSLLVHSEIDGKQLSNNDIVGLLSELVVAGNETTSTALTAMMRLLCDHPDQFEKLQANPDLIDSAVEESLRCEAPMQGTFREMTRDIELHGVAIPKGAHVRIMLGAANRDESKFSDGDTFDIERSNAAHHLTFTAGPHTCLGAFLARTEMKVAMEVLLARLENIQLADKNDFEIRDHMLVKALKALHITFSSRQ